MLSLCCARGKSWIKALDVVLCVCVCVWAVSVSVSPYGIPRKTKSNTSGIQFWLSWNCSASSAEGMGWWWWWWWWWGAGQGRGGRDVEICKWDWIGGLITAEGAACPVIIVLDPVAASSVKIEPLLRQISVTCIQWDPIRLESEWKWFHCLNLSEIGIWESGRFNVNLILSGSPTSCSPCSHGIPFWTRSGRASFPFVGHVAFDLSKTSINRFPQDRRNQTKKKYIKSRGEKMLRERKREREKKHNNNNKKQKEMSRFEWIFLFDCEMGATPRICCLIPWFQTDLLLLLSWYFLS